MLRVETRYRREKYNKNKTAIHGKTLIRFKAIQEPSTTSRAVATFLTRDNVDYIAITYITS